MEVQVLDRKSEGAERRLKLSVSASAVADAKERAAKRVARQARVPGFRPGKAPAAVVRKQFADAIRQEALETVMREAYQSVLESEKLEPVTQPHAHDVKFAEGEPLTFELHCEVKPAVELARLTGFRVKRPDPAVTDAMLDDQLAHLRDQRATWTPVEGEKPREGDLVTVQLATGDASGEGLATGDANEAREYRLLLGGGQAIAGIEELIMGVQPGETIERPVRWPDDFPDESQRGKTKTVRVTLTEAKRKSLPDLDDSLARELGDFDSVDALKKAVREDLGEQAVREADAAVRSALMDEILSANTFDVPPSWVRQVAGAYAQAYQVKEEEAERFFREFGPVALRQVRRDVVVDTIAAREGLSAVGSPGTELEFAL